MLIKAGEQDDIVKAFGAVAASERPRGQAVFQFLQTALDQPEDKHCYATIAQALSFSNRPQAAEALAKRYADMSKVVRQPLIRMGDLAVPELAPLAAQGNQSAIDDLYLIGTPDAAEALVPMLWTKGQSNNTTAWYLASLLIQPGVEAALKTYALNKLSNDQSRSDKELDKTFSWVWQPFQDNSNSAMTTIIGRIAHAISLELARESNPVPYYPSLALGPELVVPILAILSNRSFHPPSRAIQNNSRFQPSSKWNLEQIDTLLQQQANTFNANQQATSIVDVFFTQSNEDRGWRFLLNGLSPQLQLDLLRSLVTATQVPTRNDWINIFQSVQAKYRFETSWHYYRILLIAGLLSLFAVFGIWHTLLLFHVTEAENIALGFAILIFVVFYQVSAKGIDKNWFYIALSVPIVLIFAEVGLAFLFAPLAFLPVLPWIFAGLLEIILFGVSFKLWRFGQKREAMARNPLQGGLIEATLRIKYGRPRV